MVEQPVVVSHGREFASLGLIICGIEEAIIAKPGDSRELDINESIACNFFSGCI